MASQPSEDSEVHQAAPISASIKLWDAVSIIVGIVIGVSIFKAPADVFKDVAGPWQGLATWLAGGVLTLCGALCYAELATTYPRMGGDYVYLTRAYGAWMGFLFGWGQLVVVLTGSAGALAYVFADYALGLFAMDARAAVWFAVAAVVFVSLVNLCGIAAGRMMQNALTLAKVAGLLLVVVAGLFFGGPHETVVPASPARGNFVGALILIMFAYGGWSDAAFVAAEIEDARRNIPRALLLGTSAVTVIYLAVNMALLRGLGFHGVRQSATPAADVLGLMLGPWGSRGISLLVMVSALGSMHGVILTGSRLFAALGADHPALAWLGQWHGTRRCPTGAILTAAAVSLLFIQAVGTVTGRQAFDFILARIGLSAVPWTRFGGGFDTLVSGTAPVFWSFFMLTGLSLFILRRREPRTERPFSTPFFPAVPLVFCLTCGWMTYSSLRYAQGVTLLGLVPLALGLPLYFLGRRRRTHV